MKQCNKCNKELELSCFYFRKDYNNYRNNCIECEKKKANDFYNNNKQHCSERAKKYYIKNKEHLKNKSRLQWESIKNTEEYKTWKVLYGVKYRDKNRAFLTAREAKRRATKLKATPSYADLDNIRIVYEKAKWLETITGLKYEVDHVIPLQGKNVCGLHIWENLQLLEKSLNCSKSNKLGE